MPQLKEQTKTKNKQKIQQQKHTEKKNSNEMVISNLTDKEFKEMVIRMFNTLESRIEELRENCNEELENIIKNKQKMKNTLTPIKKHTRRN